MTAKALAAALPPELRAAPGGPDLEEVLFAASDAGLLEPPRSGQFVLTERTERSYDLGTLHSSFAVPPEKNIVDRMTGEVIGRAAFTGANRKVSLGGRGRRIVAEDRDRILVDSWKGTRPPKFATQGRPSLPLRTARGIVTRLGAGPGEIVQAPFEDGAILLHGLGSAGALFLAHALVTTLGQHPVRDAGALSIVLHEPLAALPTPTHQAVLDFVAGREAALARSAAMGRYHAVLPESIRRDAVRRATRLDDVADFLRSARLVNHTDPAPAFWGEL